MPVATHRSRYTHGIRSASVSPEGAPSHCSSPRWYVATHSGISVLFPLYGCSPILHLGRMLPLGERLVELAIPRQVVRHLFPVASDADDFARPVVEPSLQQERRLALIIEPQVHDGAPFVVLDDPVDVAVRRRIDSGTRACVQLSSVDERLDEQDVGGHV